MLKKYLWIIYGLFIFVVKRLASEILFSHDMRLQTDFDLNQHCSQENTHIHIFTS